jgi:hypothetical protein
MSIAREQKADAAPRARRWSLLPWYFLICFVGGGVFGLLQKLGVSMPTTPAPVWLAGCAALVIVAMGATVHWMRDIDELAQRAHYVAWFWGGSTALCVLIFFVLAAPALQQVIDFDAVEGALAPMAGKGAGFVAGVMASLAVLTLGYGAWWLVFWLRKR